MARLTEYDYLKQYKGVDVIYGLYTEEQGIKYIGYSKNVHERFSNHLRNHESETNTKKYNWINKYKDQVKIEILSVSPNNWEVEEVNQMLKYSENDLLNICGGGKDNIRKKNVVRFEDMTCQEHLRAINKSLRELNNYYKSIGKEKRFKLWSDKEIEIICYKHCDGK